MIQSVDRAIDILCMFNNQVQELGITEISQNMNLSKSTVHGLVRTLEARELLAQNPDNGKYRLGLKVYELGMAYSAAAELESASRKVAHELSARFDESVHIAVYAGGMAVFVIRKDPKMVITSFPRVGASIPANATAVGKVLLAFLPEAEVDRYLESTLYPLTLKTITDKNVFRGELEMIRARGYATDNEEAMSGIACVAAPIRDRSSQVVAALSLSGPVLKIMGDSHQEIISEVLQASAKVSRALGFVG